jgi:hypothetical protein
MPAFIWVGRWEKNRIHIIKENILAFMVFGNGFYLLYSSLEMAGIFGYKHISANVHS